MSRYYRRGYQHQSSGASPAGLLVVFFIILLALTSRSKRDSQINVEGDGEKSGGEVRGEADPAFGE